MKNILYILLFVAASGLAIISCDDSIPTTTNVTIPDQYVIVTFEGGDVAVKYGIANARKNGYVVGSTEDSWISDIDVSESDTVRFFVASNQGREERYGEVLISYMVDADTIAYNSIYVTQEYNRYYSFTANYAIGKYYGMTNLPNFDNIRQYSFYLSDVEMEEYGTFAEGATYYFFDLWTNADVGALGYVSLPAGSYSFGQTGENWTFSEKSQYFVLRTEDDDDDDYDDEYYREQYYFVGGELNVSIGGDYTTITALLEDSMDGTYDVSYSGPLSLENLSLISTLEEDMDLGDISGVPFMAQYYGDYYQTGTSNWLLYVYPEVGSGFVIDISADASFDIDGGIPVGSFTASSNGGVSGSFLRGNVFNNYLNGTWLVSFDEDGTLTAPYAPINYGTIEISASGDTYTLRVEGVDDRENNVTGSWTGVPDLIESRITTNAVDEGSGRHHLIFPSPLR